MVDDEHPPRLLPMLVLWGVGALIGLTIIGWILGVIVSAVRTVLLIGIVVAVIWAVVASRSDR